MNENANKKQSRILDLQGNPQPETPSPKQLKQKERDEEEYKKASDNYRDLINKYVERFVTAAEIGEDNYDQLNSAWKMRAALINNTNKFIVADPLVFEKAVNMIRAQSQGIPRLAEINKMYETKLMTIKILVDNYHDKELELWKNLDRVLNPGSPVQPQQPIE